MPIALSPIGVAIATIVSARLVLVTCGAPKWPLKLPSARRAPAEP
jgi:hypothetical protein